MEFGANINKNGNLIFILLLFERINLDSIVKCSYYILCNWCVIKI